MKSAAVPSLMCSKTMFVCKTAGSEITFELLVSAMPKVGLKSPFWKSVTSCSSSLRPFLKMGHSRPLFLYFRLFNTVDSKCLNTNFCRWLDLNRKESAQSTEPQLLPKCIRILPHFALELSILLYWSQLPNDLGFNRFEVSLTLTV